MLMHEIHFDSYILELWVLTKLMVIFNLIYSGFFPVAVNFLRRLPVIGTVLNLPGIRSVSYTLCLYKKKISFTDGLLLIYTLLAGRSRTIISQQRSQSKKLLYLFYNI